MQYQQCNHTNDSIGQTRGKLVDAEDVHRECLGPDKQRGLLRERTVVDLHVQIITRNDHLAGALGKVDLIPVKQPNGSQKGDEQQKTNSSDQNSLKSNVMRDGVLAHGAKIPTALR